MNKICMGLIIFGLMYPVDATAESFRELSARSAAEAAAQGRSVVAGADGWLFLTSELRHIGFGPFWGEHASANTSVQPDVADPLPAILDFNNQLRSMGITLIVVPVPPKALIYADKASASHALSSTDDYAAIEFIDRLSREGVTVVDLFTLFRDARVNERAGDDLLYCREDSHWTSYATALAAKSVVNVIETLPWIQNVQKSVFRCETNTFDIRGDLRILLDPSSMDVERVTLHRVTGEDGRSVDTNRESPVLLLGDSHTLVFHAGGDMHATGSGLADHIAFQMGFAVDVLGVRGSGATPARISMMRRARSDPDYLPSKKVVIWCFGAREFTESSGWSIIPLAPKQ